MADDDKPPAKDGDKPDPELGDGGKKALDAERKARREAETELKELRDRLKQLEDKDKSDGEKLADRITAAEKRAAEAEATALRFEVAAAKGVKPRWLSGSTREELEAAADEYLADHPPATGEGKPTPGKPSEDLRGGGDPDEPASEMNPAKLADGLPRY